MGKVMKNMCSLVRHVIYCTRSIQHRWITIALLNSLSFLYCALCFEIANGEESAQVSFWPSVELIADDASDNAQLIARSGDIEWSITESETKLKRYRAWLHWETSSPQPLETLNDHSALRRVMINAIEREVISQHAQRVMGQQITLSDSQLRGWLLKLIPGAMRPDNIGLDNFIRGRLKMRAGADLSFFWEAAADAFWVQKYKNHLVSELHEKDARAEWLRQGSLLKTWLLQIPRVPTSEEITKASSRYPKEIQHYYKNHLELFSQPLRLLVTPFWIRGGKLETQRREAIEVREALSAGESLDLLLEGHPSLVRGSTKTLRGRSIPPNTEIREGAYTPVRLTRYGWTYYLINRIYPKYVRSLKERSVQREVAAAVLRERDDLPRAKMLAEEAQKRLSKAKSLTEIKPWARRSRIRLNAPDDFFESTQGVIPTIGLAPQLQAMLFKLKPGEVTTPVAVRQHYIVAKLVSKSRRNEEWSAVRESYLKSWRLRRSPQVLDEWLTMTLKDSPRWVNTKLLKLFQPETLRFESALPALQGSSEANR